MPLLTMVSNKTLAHWIRNPTSSQFQAARNLTSLRRWCLTGTPIQNRLEDLVSLLGFLHFEPFSRSAVFNRHILEPLSKEDPNRTYRLQALLRTICLRRSETLLNLPQPQSREITVTLTQGERELYNDILKKCAREIDQVVSSQVKLKKYSVLFTAIMKLRMVCNHGTVPVNDQLLASGTVPEADQDCDMCGGTNEDNLGLVNPGDICSQCGKTFSRTPQQLTSPTFQLNGGESETLPFQFSSPHQPEPSPIPQNAVSSKVQALLDNLSEVPHGSKRYALPSVTPISVGRLLTRPTSASYSHIGPQPSTSYNDTYAKSVLHSYESTARSPTKTESLSLNGSKTLQTFQYS